MLSLTGIPPTVGFFAKLYVLVATVDAGVAWLAVAIALNAALAAFYYLRVVVYMYMREPEDGPGADRRVGERHARPRPGRGWGPGARHPAERDRADPEGVGRQPAVLTMARRTASPSRSRGPDDALGIGAWAAAIFHLVSHGFFKGLLFMGSGSVIHGAGGEQDMRFMGGLRAKMPTTYRTMLVGSLALAGIPIFAGFFSKDEILGEAFGRGYCVFYLVGIVMAAMTAFYTFRMIYMTFHGDVARRRGRCGTTSTSPPPTMTLPLVILAVPTILVGLLLGIPPESGADPRLAGPRLRALPRSRRRYPARFDLAASGQRLRASSALAACCSSWVPVSERRVSGWRTAGTSPIRRRRRGSSARIPFGLGPGMYAAPA